jgi:Tfp pilus assembly protein PilF
VRGGSGLTSRHGALPLLLGILVAAWTCLAFTPVLGDGFVNWDDHAMFVENPYHRGDWPARLRGAWTKSVLGEFMPVTWMTYAVDRSLWNLDPAGYHLTSLLLHAATALAVYLLARHLLREALGAGGAEEETSDLSVGAAVAALAFGVHPLRVEPVAWVSARGTILGGLLLVLAVLVYVVGAERGRQRGRVPVSWLLGSLLLFVASLLARATGLVLPAVLVVLDVYPLRRLGGRRGWFETATWPVWAEKVAFGVVGALAVPMGFLARGRDSMAFWDGGYDPGIAVVRAIHSSAFYVWKSVGVGSLSPVYAMPKRSAPMLGAVLLSGVALLALTGLLVALRRRWPGALTAWLVYGIVVLPLSGIVPFGRLRSAADRYTYVACIGLAVVAGGAVVLALRAWRQGRLGRAEIALVAIGTLTVLLGWSVLSWRETAVWRDSVTLWSRAVAVIPESPTARNNLGAALMAQGEFERALEQFRVAEQTWTGHPGMLTNVGRALRGAGRLEEAATTFRRVVQIVPGWAGARVDLGATLADLGRVDEAAREFDLALRADPGSPAAYYQLGQLSARQGRGAEATVLLERAAVLQRERAARGGPPVPAAVIPAGDD